MRKDDDWRTCWPTEALTCRRAASKSARFVGRTSLGLIVIQNPGDNDYATGQHVTGQVVLSSHAGINVVAPATPPPPRPRGMTEEARSTSPILPEAPMSPASDPDHPRVSPRAAVGAGAGAEIELTE